MFSMASYITIITLAALAIAGLRGIPSSGPTQAALPGDGWALWQRPHMRRRGELTTSVAGWPSTSPAPLALCSEAEDEAEVGSGGGR